MPAADSFTLAICHRDEDRVILDLVREWHVPLSPRDVQECAEILAAFGVS